jgi:hypothetical protein
MHSVPFSSPHPGHAGLPAHASVLGTLALNQNPERLAPSPPGTPPCAAAATHHRRQDRLEDELYPLGRCGPNLEII